MQVTSFKSIDSSVSRTWLHTNALPYRDISGVRGERNRPSIILLLSKNLSHIVAKHLQVPFSFLLSVPSKIHPSFCLLVLSDLWLIWRSLTKIILFYSQAVKKAHNLKKITLATSLWASAMANGQSVWPLISPPLRKYMFWSLVLRVHLLFAEVSEWPNAWWHLCFYS